MAPTLRSETRPRTPPRQLGVIEATTVKKAKFFFTWDEKPKYESQKAFCKRTGYPRSTVHKWLKQRAQLGSPACRRSRRQSQKLGRVSRIQKDDIEMLLSPTRNSWVDERYEVMIQCHHLDISARQLRRRVAALTNNAQRFKSCYVKDDLSPANEE